MTTTRTRWLHWLQRLALPVLNAGHEGCLRQRLAPEHHRDCNPDQLASSHLEAVARLLLGIAPWLAGAGGDADEVALRARLAESARRTIVHGCSPQHGDWFGIDRGLQPIVDMAFLACALRHGRSALWEPLAPGEKSLVIDAFRSLRNRKPIFNNWLLFAAASEAMLKEVGADWDPMRIDFALRQHQQWYLGDGHYGDGPHFHQDWYNSFVMHPLLDSIVEAVADEDGFWREFQPQIHRRLARYAVLQERSIASDGSFPAVGRSLTYRCGAFHALAHAAWRGLLPPELTPAQVRCALTAVCAKTLDDADNWRPDGFLRIGLCGHQPSLGESYINTGSLYLCSTALLPLGLPPEHPWWQSADQPWTAVRLFVRGDDLEADHALKD